MRKIGIKEQKILKGIAIVGMMMLHFWGNPDWILPNNMYDGIFPNSIYESIGKFGNVCVSIFAFLTGYSFWVRGDKWDSNIYRRNKIVVFLVDYWIYMTLFILVGLFFKEPMPSVLQFCVNLVGIEVAVGTVGISVPFAWYVSFYISVLLLYPIIKQLWSGSLLRDICNLSITYFTLKILAQVTQDYYGVGFFFSREGVLVIVIIGFLSAKYDIFEEIEKYKRKDKKSFYIENTLIILILITLRIYNNNVLIDWWGIIYTLYIIYFVLQGLFDKVRLIGEIFERLGKYSMGMWFISGIFFIKKEVLQIFAYFPRRPELILLWVIFITFIVSFIITNLKKGIKSYIDSMEIPSRVRK